MWWANVETKPYGGYPQFWDMKILKLLDEADPEGQRWASNGSQDPKAPYGRFDGKTIFEAKKSLQPGSSRVLMRNGTRPTSMKTTRWAKRGCRISMTKKV
jgi:hypothetical protein